MCQNMIRNNTEKFEGKCDLIQHLTVHMTQSEENIEKIRELNLKQMQLETLFWCVRI